MRRGYPPLGQAIMKRLAEMGERPTQRTLIELMKQAGYHDDYRRISTYMNGTRMPRPGFVGGRQNPTDGRQAEARALGGYAATFPDRAT